MLLQWMSLLIQIQMSIRMWPQLPIPQVDIAPLLDFQNIQPVIPLPEDEIQVEDLLGFVGNNGNNLHEGDFF